MLFAFHVLQTYREDVQQYMRVNVDPVLNLLHEIHILFTEGQFAEGKFKWVQQFPLARQQNTWNLWGAEDEYSFCKLDCRTTYKMICSSRDMCDHPVKIMTSYMICFR